MESKVIFFVIILPIFLNYCIAIIFKQDLNRIIPLAYFLIILWLMIFGLIGQINLGFKLLLPTSIIIVLICALTMRSFFKKTNLLFLLSPQLVLFYVVTISTMYFTQSLRLTKWDEFSHWGPAVKSLYLFNLLGPDSPASLNFPSYPPGLTLFSFFIVRASGYWSESYIFWSYYILIFAILISLIRTIRWKYFYLLIPSFFILTLITTYLFDSFETIYADPILGLMFGSSLILATKKVDIKDFFATVYLSVNILILSLVKETGIFFAFIVILVFSLSQLFYKKGERKICIVYKFLIVIFPTLLFLNIWKIYLDKDNLKGQLAPIEGISDLIFTNLTTLKGSYRYEVMVLFKNALFDNPIISLWIFPLSPAQVVFLLSTLYIFFQISTSFLDTLFHVTLSMTLLVGFFMYQIILLLLYLSHFGEYEAVRLASYDRYTKPYLVGLLILLFSSMINKLLQYNLSIIKLSIFTLSVFLVLPNYNFSNLFVLVGGKSQIYNDFKNSFEPFSMDLSRKLLTKDDKVWVIAQHTEGFEFHFLKYNLLPASTNLSSWSIGSSFDSTDVWTDDSINSTNWKKSLINYDYLYIFKVSDSFTNEFGSLFEMSTSKIEVGFYKVIHNFDDIVLIKV